LITASAFVPRMKDSNTFYPQTGMGVKQLQVALPIRLGPPPPMSVLKAKPAEAEEQVRSPAGAILTTSY